MPMDETLTRVSVDVSKRPHLEWSVNFSKPLLGEMDTELFHEWFAAFAQNLGATIHLDNIYGENNHHMAESCFKGLARCLKLYLLTPEKATEFHRAKEASETNNDGH